MSKKIQISKKLFIFGLLAPAYGASRQRGPAAPQFATLGQGTGGFSRSEVGRAPGTSSGILGANRTQHYPPHIQAGTFDPTRTLTEDACRAYSGNLAPTRTLTEGACRAYSGNLAPALAILAQVMFANAAHFAELLVECLECSVLVLSESMELLYLTGAINLVALLILVVVFYKLRPSKLFEGYTYNDYTKNFFILCMLAWPALSTVLSLVCSYFCPISYLWIARIVTLAPLLFIELCRPSDEVYTDKYMITESLKKESLLSTISLLVGVVSIAGMFLPIAMLPYLPYLSLALYCIAVLAFIYGTCQSLDLMYMIRSSLGFYHATEGDASEGEGEPSQLGVTVTPIRGRI